MRTIKYLAFLGGVFAAVWIVGIAGVGNAQAQTPTVCTPTSVFEPNIGLNTVVMDTAEGQELPACFHRNGAVRLVSDLSECKSSETAVTLLGESGGAPRLVKTIARQDLTISCGPSGSQPTTFVDLQIVTEIIEAILQDPIDPAFPITRFPIVEKRFEVIACERPADSLASVACALQTLAPSPLVCSGPGAFPGALLSPAIGMNTVSIGDVVKTIGLRSDRGFCEVAGSFVPNTLLVGVFTEIFEVSDGTNVVPVAKRVEVSECVIDSTSLPLQVSCGFGPEQVLLGGS